MWFIIDKNNSLPEIMWYICHNYFYTTNEVIIIIAKIKVQLQSL